MKCRAVQMGFVNGARVRPGGVFTLPDGAKVPSWAVAIDEKKPAPEPEPKRAPVDVARTMSEMNKRNTPRP